MRFPPPFMVSGRISSTGMSTLTILSLLISLIVIVVGEEVLAGELMVWGEIKRVGKLTGDARSIFGKLWEL